MKESWKEHRLDEDAEGFEEHFDDAFPHIQQYYAVLTPALRGVSAGFFDTRLADFHHGPNLPEERLL